MVSGFLLKGKVTEVTEVTTKKSGPRLRLPTKLLQRYVG